MYVSANGLTADDGQLVREKHLLRQLNHRGMLRERADTSGAPSPRSESWRSSDVAGRPTLFDGLSQVSEFTGGFRTKGGPDRIAPVDQLGGHTHQDPLYLERVGERRGQGSGTCTARCR